MLPHGCNLVHSSAHQAILLHFLILVPNSLTILHFNSQFSLIQLHEGLTKKRRREVKREGKNGLVKPSKEQSKSQRKRMRKRNEKKRNKKYTGILNNV